MGRRGRGHGSSATRQFQDDGEGTFYADGYVHPDRFGRGIGALLVELAERRAAEQLEAVAQPRVVIQNTVLHVDRAAHGLLEGRGYRPVRHFLRMQIDMSEPPPAPVWPAGVLVAPFRPDEDLAAVHACVHEAFAARVELPPRGDRRLAEAEARGSALRRVALGGRA